MMGLFDDLTQRQPEQFNAPSQRGMFGDLVPQQPPLAVRAGRMLREVPRQIGLTARYGIEGATALPAMVADIPGRVVNLGMSVAEDLGAPSLPRVPLASQAIPAALDLAGLPQPRGPNERVAADITRTMAGAAGAAGAANQLGRLMSGPGRAVTDALSARVGTQVAAGAGAGAAGGSVREADGGPWEQMIASLFGGLAGGAALPAMGNKALAFKDWAMAQAAPKPSPQLVDLQISLALQRQGIDYGALSADVRTALRSEVQDALKTGGVLRPDTLARLADFRTVGATPTRGTLTLDPVQLTREKNLAKVGANSTDSSLQRLPQLEAANNRALIESVNQAGGATQTSRVAAGEQLVGAADDWIARQKDAIDALYNRARDSQGRSFPLDSTFLTNRAADLLEDNLVSASLPTDVRNRLNQIARGEMPLTVDTAEMLKTRIATLQRNSSDGSVRRSLGLVRQAIDETPIVELGRQSGPVGAARAVNPGGLPSVPGSTQLGDDAVAAFNQARAANRSMMTTIERVPALKAVADGVEPDKFVQQFIVGDGKDASVRAVREFANLALTNPEVREVARQQVALFLRRGALGNAPDDVGRFSAAGFRNALDRVGPEKLAIFFSPQEIARLQATSRVANFTTVQPVGSAINNSNSGAMVVASGLDLLDRIAARVPLVGDTIQGVVRGVQQSAALNVPPALAKPRPAPRPLTIAEIARSTSLPAATGLMLSTLPGVQRREDDRRQ
jgi:hypothetical protein